MASKQIVLMVGGTGNMGGKIAAALAKKETVEIRALVRSIEEPDAKKRERMTRLESLGAQLVEGDLADAESLSKACAGVHTVLSTVNGDREVALTGQLNLLKAAKKAGVSVFMPSDYSFNYNRIEIGDVYNYDFRIAVAQAVRESEIGYIFVMSGSFMESFLRRFSASSTSRRERYPTGAMPICRLT